MTRPDSPLSSSCLSSRLPRSSRRAANRLKYRANSGFLTVLLTVVMAATIARTMDEHVVIVGAGPAGLAAAWAIRRAGRDPLVVEQADAVAASWRGRHDHLRLNTHRAFSHQPGARIPRRCGAYPARDDYVAYLQEYSAGMRLRLDTRVHRIDRTDGGWALALDGGSLTAAHAVIATGSDAEPVLPSWPGLESFEGTVLARAIARLPAG